MRRRILTRGGAERVGIAALGWLLVAWLALPLVALVGTASLADLRGGLDHPLVGPALGLSLLTTALSLLLTVVLGTPLAWWLAERPESRGARALEVTLQLPLVMPPAVAGVALLLAFGRRGVFAGWLAPEGGSLAFTTAAVVVAQVFVSAPLYVRSATEAFRQVDRSLLVLARTLGASPLQVLVRVALPLAGRGLVAGAALSWARALGEFGATLMFAGNLAGVTQTLPLAVYTALATDLPAAQALSLALVAVAFAVLLGVQALERRRARRSLDAAGAP